MQIDDSWFELLGVLCLLVIGLSILVYHFEIYRASPNWGPIRKFESEGSEDLRINQLLVHKHMVEEERKKQAKNQAATKAADQQGHDWQPVPAALQGGSNSYGALGKTTWGTCEAPWTSNEKTWSQTHGKVVNIRHFFSDTQFLRTHSAHWARDEPHMLQAHGVHCSAPSINENAGELTATRMV